jgi:glycosyltransferase involved in cell wall biosynthesis
MPTESARRNLRESLGGATDDPTIGIVAHILPHKGFDDLVQALPLIVQRIPRVRCLVVGEAPRKKHLDHLLDLAERLAVRDRLVWVGAQEDVLPFLDAMDLFVLPSHTEGLPLTVLEAMAAGRPVVGTAVGGIPEAVRHGETGFVVPPRDPRRLAEAVIDVLANPALAKSRGEAGRASAKDHFHWKPA